MGKIVQVAPYSGDMLPMVARVSTESDFTSGSERLDELADDAVVTKKLGDGEHDVGRGDTLARRADDAQSDDRRDQHRGRLAEHAGFSFDAADAPAEHAESVDHGRVRVGADHRVEVRDAFEVEDDLRQVFEVDLVTDAHARRHDAELLERALRPLQKGVALGVALVLDLDVLFVARRRFRCARR